MAINYIHLARLINLVPHDLNRKTKKDPLPKKTRQNVVEKLAPPITTRCMNMIKMVDL